MKKVFLLLCLFYLVFCCASSLADPNNPRVIISSLFGDIAVELFPDDAPISTENFLHYVTTGFYNSTIIHRTVTPLQGGIGISQGGGFYFSGGSVQYKPPDRPGIINESYNGLSNTRGTIAMARTPDPNSATSQFFINQIDNTYFDKANNPDGFGYCVFGKVLSGMDIIDYVTYLPHIADTNLTLGMKEVPYYHTLNGYDYPIYIWEAFVAPEGYWFKADFNYDGIVDEKDLTLIIDNWLGTAQLGDMEVVGNIDFTEFAKFAKSWRRTSVWYREIPSDIDNSGQVNFKDFALFAQDWDKNGTELYGDFNLDSTVNFNDLSLFADDWLKTSE